MREKKTINVVHRVKIYKGTARSRHVAVLIMTEPPQTKETELRRYAKHEIDTQPTCNHQVNVLSWEDAPD